MAPSPMAVTDTNGTPVIIFIWTCLWTCLYTKTSWTRKPKPMVGRSPFFSIFFLSFFRFSFFSFSFKCQITCLEWDIQHIPEKWIFLSIGWQNSPNAIWRFLWTAALWEVSVPWAFLRQRNLTLLVNSRFVRGLFREHFEDNASVVSREMD